MISEKILSEVQFIFLAGGKGTRMNSDVPKVMVHIPYTQKSLIGFLLEHLVKDPTKFKYSPIIIVGYEKEMVIDHLGPSFTYVEQDEQLGTGHAVSICREVVMSRKPKHVVVVYGDMPFFSQKSVLALVEERENSESVLSMATQEFSDFEDWRSAASRYGRVIRDDLGNFEKIIEFKDATEEQRKILEVSSAHYCFDPIWLFDNIVNLDNDNVQGEYYLTELPRVAINQGRKITTVKIDAVEALGANTKEELEILGTILKEKHF